MSNDEKHGSESGRCSQEPSPTLVALPTVAADHVMSRYYFDAVRVIIGVWHVILKPELDKAQLVQAITAVLNSTNIEILQTRQRTDNPTRDDVLDEAAKICDDVVEKFCEENSRHQTTIGFTGVEAARRIRALRGKPRPETALHPPLEHVAALLVTRVGEEVSFTAHDLQRASQYQLRWNSDGHRWRLQVVRDT